MLRSLPAHAVVILVEPRSLPAFTVTNPRWGQEAEKIMKASTFVYLSGTSAQWLLFGSIFCTTILLLFHGWAQVHQNRPE